MEREDHYENYIRELIMDSTSFDESDIEDFVEIALNTRRSLAIRNRELSAEWTINTERDTNTL